MSDSDSKTEQATPRRRADARKDGQVQRSEDLLHVLLFGLFFSYLILDGRRLAQELISLIVLPYRFFSLPFSPAVHAVTGILVVKALTLILTVLIAAVVMSLLIQLLQIGPLFSSKSITPSLKKLNAVKNIKEIFSFNSLVDLMKMVVKTTLMCFIVYRLMLDNLSMLIHLPPAGVPGIVAAEGYLMQQFTMMVFFTFAVLALFDFFWQRHRLSKQLMMEKHEVRREHKDNEGDPVAKGYRRNLFREIISGDIERVPMASAVVANPTHLAIALFYRPPLTGLPVIIAKGKGAGAQRIFDAARKAGVPIIQNIPVARSLFKINVMRSIPADLIDAVAEIIVTAREIRRAAGYQDPDQSPDIPDGGETVATDGAATSGHPLNP